MYTNHSLLYVRLTAVVLMAGACACAGMVDEPSVPSGGSETPPRSEIEKEQPKSDNKPAESSSAPTPTAPSPTAPSPAAAPRQKTPTLFTLGTVLAYGGVVAWGVTAGASIATLAKASKLGSSCDKESDVCPRSEADTIDSYKLWADVTTITLIAGAVLVSGGLSLRAAAPIQTVSSTPSVRPYAGLGGAGLVGRF